MDPALRAMLHDTVTIAPLTGRDVYGAVAYGVPMSRPARIQQRMVTLFTGGGRQVVPETKVVLDGDVPLPEGFRMTMPDGTQPPIQGVETYTDELGTVDHYTLLL